MSGATRANCQITELRTVKRGLAVIAGSDRPTINIVVRANPQQHRMPGSAVNQAGNRNPAAFAIQIRNRHRRMHRMQNQDPNQQLAPRRHNALFHDGL